MSRTIQLIIYTDDDPDDHLFFAEALNGRRPDINLLSFYTCSDILDYFKDTTSILPGMIFLDQNIAGNTNNECLKSIRKIVRLNNIPVVIYTTGASPKLMDEAIGFGAYQYVLKPNHLDDIADNLAAIISRCENEQP